MPLEIVVEYDVPGTTNALSVFHFDSSQPVGTARQALGVMFTEMDEILSTEMSLSVRNYGRILDDQSGALTGEWSDPTAVQVRGQGQGHPVANATSFLMKWQTGDIVNGRFVRGRTFVPGMSVAILNDGGISPTAAALIGQAGQGLITTATGFGIWHRPTNGLGGAMHDAISCTAWQEMAVQRRRR